METDSLYLDLQHFLVNEPACQSALGCLNSKAQIGVSIGETLFFTVENGPNGIQVEQKDAAGADFHFAASPDAVEIMIAEKGLSPAQLGIKLVQQVLAQQIELSMPGHFLQVLRKGYLDIIALGGKEFLTGLNDYDLSSVFKILEYLKNLKKF